MSNFNDTFNGAKCKSYCWSQSHSDLEIRIKLTKNVRYENVNLDITSNFIRVELLNFNSNYNDDNLTSNSDQSNDCDKSKDSHGNRYCLMSGNFENSILTESIYWLIDVEDLSIVIYLDKKENKWWQKLLSDDEQVFELGPRNYTIQMEHLDDGTRMIVDKLICEQKNKLSSKELL